MSGSDLLRDAVAELYACDPAEFVARRGDLAGRARTAGETATARQIAGLRKPTRSAWVVNRLARAEPDAADRLAELGAELGAAQQALDGEAIRRLSQQRRELVNALARDAFAAAGQRSPSASLREEVVTTLSAALVDPEVAELLRAGAVQRVVSRDGLGSGAERGSPAAWSRATVGSPRSRSPAGSGSTVVPLRRGRRAGEAGAGSSAPGGAGQERPGAKVTALAAARAKAEHAKAEQARAERARRRKAIVAAEQVVARAERAERSAARTEQNQEDRVRLLETELAEARQRLAEARLAARRARTEQRQARRALDRLRDAPGPGENG